MAKARVCGTMLQEKWNGFAERNIERSPGNGWRHGLWGRTRTIVCPTPDFVDWCTSSRTRLKTILNRVGWHSFFGGRMSASHWTIVSISLLSSARGAWTRRRESVALTFTSVPLLVRPWKLSCHLWKIDEFITHAIQTVAARRDRLRTSFVIYLNPFSSWFYHLSNFPLQNFPERTVRFGSVVVRQQY